MATGDDETAGNATVADRPTGEPSTMVDRPVDDLGPGDATIQLPSGAAGAVPTVLPISTPGVLKTPIQMLADSSAKSHSTSHGMAVRTGSQVSLTTALEAMRNEEVERTRQCIRLGWGLSAIAMGTVPFVDAPLAMDLAFLGAMALGIVVSFFFHRAFADETKYDNRALIQLAVMSAINASVAVLYYGVFTACTGINMIGIHFVARTDSVRTARWIFGTAVVCYGVSVTPIILGVFEDPGVFSSDRPLDLKTQLIGAGFVLGVYILAYATARAFRFASLKSIEDLQRATRLASQREALMDELRADLERALRIGGPGRYSDQTIGNQFKLGTVLGRGAMGEVYEATDITTGAPAAVKLLRRELLSDSTQVARFLREVRTSAALDSPHIVKILGSSAADAELPYLAMELLHGTTLSEILRNEPRMPPSEVLDLVRQVGAGIDAAARGGIVHRDLKPQNLFRIGELATVWKILDFGVATLTEDTGTLTQGGIVGTPHYMAPEQAQGQRVDGRADVYALAAVAYRCLTGRHPFNAPDTPALLYAVVHKMPTRPSELDDALGEDVDRWFALALAKSLDDRFASGAALVMELQAALTGTLDPKLRKRADALIRKRPWD